MLTQSVEVGLDECSKHDLISVLYAYFESFMLNTYTVLVAIFSWAIRTWNKNIYLIKSISFNWENQSTH